MIQILNFPLVLSLSKGEVLHTAMVRQAHHERLLNDLKGD
jgi:hypothetical protein